MARVGLIKNIEKGVFVARASVTKNHKLGALNNRNLLSHSSGGLKSKVKVLELVSSECRRGENLFHTSHLASVASGIPWLMDHDLSVSSHNFPSTCVSLFPNFLF